MSQVESGDLSIGSFCSELIRVAKRNPDIDVSTLSTAAKLQNFPNVFGLQLQEAALDALLKGTTEPAQGLLTMSSLVQDSNPQAFSAVGKMFVAARESEMLVKNGDLKGLRELAKKADNDYEKKVIYARFAPLALGRAKQEISTKPAKSLEGLKGIPEAWRSSEFYQITQQAVIAMSSGVDLEKFAPIAYTKETDEFLDELEGNLGAAVFDSIAQIRSAWVMDLLRGGNVNQADLIFEKVIRGRRDPNKLNDDLRFNILLVSKSDEARDFAQGRMVELRQHGAIDAKRKLSLLMSGYYGKVHIYIGIACGGLFVFLVLFFSFWRKIARFLLRLTGRKGKTKPGYLRPASGMDQYSILLAKLGLEDNATDAEIKAAYRNKLKELHPDKHAGQEQEAEKVQELIEVKKCYKRILQIQQSRFNN
jgi:hypothetical protein